LVLDNLTLTWFLSPGGEERNHLNISAEWKIEKAEADSPKVSHTL
jgi:hypothetical protein